MVGRDFTIVVDRRGFKQLPVLVFGHASMVSWRILMSNRWVSVQDVADHLGINKDTVYKWIDSRALPAHKVGRLWRFQLQEIDEWVRRGGASTGGEG